jgi:hypothetical protein
MEFPIFGSDPKTNVKINEVTLTVRQYINSERESLPNQYQIIANRPGEHPVDFTTSDLHLALQGLLNRIIR